MRKELEEVLDEAEMVDTVQTTIDNYMQSHAYIDAHTNSTQYDAYTYHMAKAALRALGLMKEEE